MRVTKLIAGTAAAALVFSLGTVSVSAAGYAGAGHHLYGGCAGSYVGYGMHHNPYCAAPGYNGSGIFGSSFGRANAAAGNAVAITDTIAADTTPVVASVPAAAAESATPAVPAPNPPAEAPAAAPNVIVTPPVVNNAYNGMYNGVHHNEYNGGYNGGYGGGHHGGGHH